VGIVSLRGAESNPLPPIDAGIRPPSSLEVCTVREHFDGEFVRGVYTPFAHSGRVLRPAASTA
jgi:hypothetical protein